MSPHQGREEEIAASVIAVHDPRPTNRMTEHRTGGGRAVKEGQGITGYGPRYGAGRHGILAGAPRVIVPRRRSGMRPITDVPAAKAPGFPMGGRISGGGCLP
ncbi:hypothetical protein IBTHAUMO2_480006 [Nitrosopumilaceae archaeon]|nr:hypothetical protein IBTHAUMO2_480006 [Nitrosopumilaceae archaeon]